MSQPTTIYEVMYTDGTVYNSTRSSHIGNASSYWYSRNLPASGKSTLDTTVDGGNCEIALYYFEGHGSGNYVTNYKFYVGNSNAVAQDMTHMFYSSAVFINPTSYSDADIYNETGSWTEAPTTVPGSPNVATMDKIGETDDPTMTEFVYFGVVVEASKSTGTGTWENILLYQYT